MKAINPTSLKYALFLASLILCSNADISVGQIPTKKIINVNSNINLNWNNYKSGVYSYQDATCDFGSILDWAPTRTHIAKSAFRVTLLPNLLSGHGGLVAKTLIEEGTVYDLSYAVKFDKDFEFGKGGKIGFGLRIGDGNTGCDRANDGNGGSSRLMWYTSAGTTKFKPYLYYYDMPETCGDNMVSSAFYPKEGSIKKDKWYKIKMYVKSNSGLDKDGRIKVFIDGNPVLDQPIRWTANNSKKFINKLSNDTFRGGSGDDWKTNNIGYIYLDKLNLKKLE